VAIVVLDTGTRRGLANSAYNQRRRECEAAARAMGVATLRDVDADLFARHAERLEPLLRRRARHLITENQRTLAAAAAMQAGDAGTLGMLMNQSHESLREDYEVSSAALDTMVAYARAQPACFGARMTGAGFGGCVVALVRQAVATEFAAAVTTEYQKQTSRTAIAHVCQAAEGAELCPVPADLGCSCQTASSTAGKSEPANCARDKSEPTSCSTSKIA
jgi:galactokinase